VSFVLCTVPDQDAGLAEIRVLWRGGTLCASSTTKEELLFPDTRTPVSSHIAGHAPHRGR
jgi:hypothetical protein